MQDLCIVRDFFAAHAVTRLTYGLRRVRIELEAQVVARLPGDIQADRIVFDIQLIFINDRISGDGGAPVTGPGCASHAERVG